MPALKGKKLSPEHCEKIRISGLGRKHSKGTKERIRLTRTTHGLAYSKFWHSYKGLRARCTNKNNPSYHRYGGRGIKVEWQSFEDFIRDMHQSYLEHVKQYGDSNTTIERIDNDGNYCKENCRWATKQEQVNNTARSVFLTYNGVTLTIQQWNKKLGFYGEKTLRSRLERGWSIEKALTIPPQLKK